MDAIPTMLNLNERGVQVEPIYPLCKDDIESVEHVIFKCDIAGCLWKMREDCPISMMEINRDVSDLAIDGPSQQSNAVLEQIDLDQRLQSLPRLDMLRPLMLRLQREVWIDWMGWWQSVSSF